jgi:heme oxygenase
MREVAASASANASTLCASAQLKAGTQPLHHQLDHQTAMQRLMAPDLTLAEYAALLERMARCYRTMEAALDAFVLAHPQAAHWADPAVYRRTPDIGQDLHALQGHALSPATYLQAQRGQSFMVSSAAQAAGCMYVLGGARMGARVIVRALRSHLGVAASGALHFFGAAQATEASDFLALRAKLDAELTTPGAVQEALASAQEVFGVFIHEFSKTG